MQRLKDKGFASSNVVFGIGSYSYQHTTRDTFGFALKSTSVTVGGMEKAIFKDPVTDTNHTKRSAKGRVMVRRVEGRLELVDGLMSTDDFTGDELRTIFRDGIAQNFQTLYEIRDRLAAA